MKGGKVKGLVNNWTYFKRLSFALKIKKKANPSDLFNSHLNEFAQLKLNSKPAIQVFSSTIKTSRNSACVEVLLNLAVKLMQETPGVTGTLDQSSRATGITGRRNNGAF